LSALPDSSELLQCQAWIDGKAVPASSQFAVYNPASGQKIADVSDCSMDTARNAIAAATRAFAAWRSVPVDERIQRCNRWAELIEDNANGLGRINALESGKPLGQAIGEAGQCAALLRWFTEQAARLDNSHAIPDNDQQVNYVIRQPVGVVACITPWNFPAAAVVVKAGAGIVCGCATIVKPSEETPLIALALAKLASAAGIPDGILNVLPCQNPVAVGEALCQDPNVRMLTFTGSIAVGQQLYAACGRTVKRLALELGGNAPFIVFDDADLDKALDGAMGARFYNSGQICVGANRYYIHDAVYDEFAARISGRVRKLNVGDGFATATDVGPMINRAAVDRLNGLVEEAAASGAEILAGGTQPDSASSFFLPTVLSEMQPTMKAHSTEIFGPIVCLYRFSDEQDVLRLANATDAGLSAYIYTADADRLLRFAEDLEAGVIGANSSNIFANDLPFGGIKQSGIGREHGPDCLDEYLEVKSICRGAI
jgi:succinate-semialdehyde dehydrogenase/glutarate-semialdehyde dehydrogenase